MVAVDFSSRASQQKKEDSETSTTPKKNKYPRERLAPFLPPVLSLHQQRKLGNLSLKDQSGKGKGKVDAIYCFSSAKGVFCKGCRNCLKGVEDSILQRSRRSWVFAMGHKRPSLRSKAAHLVSDITTVLLNPISDEPSTPRGDGTVMGDPEVEDAETESKDVDGPDTSSFTAFLISLLSSAESSGHSNEEPEESHVKMGELVSSSGNNENAGRKGLIARGKQSLGRVLQKTSRISGYRDKKLEQKADHHLTNASNPSLHELMPLNIPKNTASQLNLPAISEPSLLLSENMRNDLYVSLPAVIQGKNWVLLYSTWRHGISLSTLYRRSTLCPGFCLLVVGDRMGAIFGGLVEAPLHPTSKRKYQGTNNTFVFTILSSHPVIFRPTGANHYFTLCSTDYLALGGGGHFALYLDGDLLNGSSSTSETFGNSCLAHSSDFEVKEVELWGFVYASKYEEMMALCRTEAPGICRW